MQEERLARLEVLADRVEIQDAIYQYAQAVDRSDWAGVRAAYHSDAYDDHGDYKGDIDGLIAWLEARFAGAENGMHFVGNCLIEFFGEDRALVETYFVSHRQRAPANGAERAQAGVDGAMIRQGWGRYIDEFERRGDKVWRVARRVVVLDSVLNFATSNAARQGRAMWGVRARDDLYYERRAALMGQV